MVDILGKKNIVILAAVVLLSIIAAILIYPYPTDIQELDIYLKVGNYTGIDVDTSAVVFGTIMPTGRASRDIVITNEDVKQHKIRINIAGKLKDWITMSDNRFNLDASENRTITLTINVPGNARYGNYTDRLMIIFG